MPTFIINANYTPATVKGLMKNARNRRAAVAALVEKAGGKLKEMYVTTGAHDVMIIADLPDGSDALAINMAIGNSGAGTGFETIRAWTPEEFEAVAGKAAEIAGAYSPPGS